MPEGEEGENGEKTFEEAVEELRSSEPSTDYGFYSRDGFYLHPRLAR